MKLDRIDEVERELKTLAGSLIKRMRLDLTSLAEDDDIATLSMDENANSVAQKAPVATSRKWIALPRSLRLSTRPRPPLNADGSRPRIFARISKSSSMPSLVFSLGLTVESLAERLTEEALMPLFRRLHPEKSGWNLSLVNVCATNMSLTASASKNGVGRDIGEMFSRQENALKECRCEDIEVKTQCHGAVEERSGEPEASEYPKLSPGLLGSEDIGALAQDKNNEVDSWNNEDELGDVGDACRVCGFLMPPYAMVAHERFHALPD